MLSVSHPIISMILNGFGCCTYTDNIDSSGMRFTLTRTPRQHNAGIFGLGSVINTNLFIPPNTDQFNVYGYCPSSCTNQVKIIKATSI